jgi:hypothetical protein
MHEDGAGHRLDGADALADAGVGLAAHLDTLRVARRRRQRALVGSGLDRALSSA